MTLIHVVKYSIVLFCFQTLSQFVSWFTTLIFVFSACVWYTWYKLFQCVLPWSTKIQLILEWVAVYILFQYIVITLFSRERRLSMRSPISPSPIPSHCRYRPSDDVNIGGYWHCMCMQMLMFVVVVFRIPASIVNCNNNSL